MRRQNRRGVGWETPTSNDFRWEHVTVEVLMDIREELQRLNTLLHCSNFVAIPHKLERIARNTVKPRKRKPTKGKG
jgi:hypothetical protein